MIKKLLPFLVILGLVFVFFWQFFLKGMLPIPSDTIVGLYYPFKEIYFKTNPNGVPFKNFLITDPVRQQIPWKELSIQSLKVGNLPLWNPYNFAGTPLLANFQSGVFYPLNLIFFILPFVLAWSIFILLEPFLALLFTYLYLRNLNLRKLASLMGAISFSFSGFFIAWLTWGNILHTALWLPLILLSIDKIFSNFKSKIHFKKKLLWYLVLLFSLISALFAGHLQVFFYLLSISIVYLIAAWLKHGKNFKLLYSFVAVFAAAFLLSLIQIIPTLSFISLSARNVDIVDWSTVAGWFIPWQNLIQFIVPDFFGNPATLNYFGVWNYGEFVGYIGLGSLIFAFFSFFRRDKKTLFFFVVLLVSLIFALSTVFAKIPFELNLPFISTSQPTRLIFIIDFCLSVLVALGLDYFMRLEKKTKVLHILVLFTFLFAAIWIGVMFIFKQQLGDNFFVARQNLILPTVLFIFNALLIVFATFVAREKVVKIIFSLIILLLVFDLFRFGWKFEPFTSKAYFFPSTTVTNFLQKQQGVFRVMSTDSRIFPPNFSSVYGIQTLDGYDPLYLRRFGELMAASNREKPDISSPFGFNRIITSHNYLSNMSDFMNIKYVLSFEEIKDTKLKQVFSDGVVKVYENTKVFQRAFFVENTYIAKDKEDAIKAMYDSNYPLNKRAVVEGVADKTLFKNNWSLGKVNIQNYSSNNVVLKTNTSGNAFLVLTDSYYPNWNALVDGKKTKIYLTDYNFRGIIVPKGQHEVKFYISF